MAGVALGCVAEGTKANTERYALDRMWQKGPRGQKEEPGAGDGQKTLASQKEREEPGAGVQL